LIVQTPSDREYLVDRVHALDAAATDYESDDQLTRDICAYMRVLGDVVSVDGVRTPVLKANEADIVISTSHMLARLGEVAPQIVRGSLDRHSQYWISTANFPWLKPADPQLSSDKFVPITKDIRASTKPFYAGLYTYTGIAGSRGMWREYIEGAMHGSGFDRPWHIWNIGPNPSARVCEVNQAVAWADLCARYPLVEDGLIYPDWFAIAEDYDAVHLTAMAIAAIQGIRISTDHGLAAPSYWHVESTFWLRWSFDTVSEVEIVS
jgi:hypothetical protein